MPREGFADKGQVDLLPFTGHDMKQTQRSVQEKVASSVLKGQFAKDTTNVNLSNQLALCYLKFANSTAATKYIKKTLQIDANNPIGLQLKAQIEAIEK